MPNRILREGILSSDRINALSDAEEVFYRRLMSVVDDYGRFDGRPTMLIAACYPLRVSSMREAHVMQLLAACVRAGLVRLYKVAGKPYLELLDFRQQVRSKSSRYPDPPPARQPTDAPQPPADDKQVHSTCAADATQTPDTRAASAHLDVDVDVDVGERQSQKLSSGVSPPRAVTPVGVVGSSTTTTLPTKRVRAREAEAPTAAVWQAYSDAYFRRYQVEPARNATVNGQLANLVARLGAQEAPHVAAFYVANDEPLYRRKRHPVGLLLHDAEGLRTQWARGDHSAGLSAVGEDARNKLQEWEPGNGTTGR